MPWVLNEGTPRAQIITVVRQDVSPAENGRSNPPK